MKTILSLLFTAITLSAFIIFPTDYRDTYVGAYNCTRKCQVLNSDYTELSYVTSDATVVISKNTQDSILNILIGGKTLQAKLKNGVMRFSEKGVRTTGKFFSTDSISFSTSSGLGPNECIYKGKKQ